MQHLLLCSLLLLLTKLMEFISLGQENTESTGQDSLVLGTGPAWIMICVTLHYDNTQKTKAELFSPFWWCKPRLILMGYNKVPVNNQKNQVLSIMLPSFNPLCTIECCFSEGFCKWVVKSFYLCFKTYSHIYCFVFPSILKKATMRIN